MARQVLLSFDGAAEIPFTPYQATQDREAEVPGIPGIPAIPGTPAIPGLASFPGLAAGEVAQWRLESNANVPGTNRIPNHPGSIEIGQMSFYLVDTTIITGYRWYSTASTTEWHNFSEGLNYVEISTIDTFGTNREEELLAIPLGVPFYIYHLEISPHGLLFRWEVIPTQVRPILWTGGAGDATYVHYPIHAQLQVYNGVDWDKEC